MAQVGKLSTDDRISYESSLKYYRDIHNVIDTAEEKGFVEGKAEGEYRKAVEIAENLLDILDSATIAEKTGLTIDQIDDLRK